MFLTPNKTIVGMAMSTKYKVVKEGKNLEVIIDIMVKENLSEVFVTSNDEMVIGVITRSDISKILEDGVSVKSKVENYMIKNIISIEEEILLEKARNIMIENKIGSLPVVKEGKLVGVIRSDIIRDHFYMEMEDVGRRLNYIINNIHEAVCVIDNDGVVVVWNSNAEKLYDAKAETIIGKKLVDFFPDAILNKVLITRQGVHNVSHSPRPDCNIAISAQPIYINGEFSGVVSTDRDITEVEKLSKDLNREKEKVSFLKDEFDRLSNEGFGKVLGKSTEIRKNIEIAKKVAKTSASIMINGESGTGKEVFSRAIHKHSGRPGLFVPVNCSAIPDELFESEFFGYEGGAFTGASKKGKMGIFELANSGTVFLDEIADLPLHMQAKLLRVLQENELRRIGGEKMINIDCRIICATNKNLEKMVEQETFREDLYFRLNVITLHLPSLRSRESDLDLFVHKFLVDSSTENNKPICRITPEAMKILRNYKWKGNVRELKNTIEHMVVLNSSGRIEADDIPEYILKSVKSDPVLISDDMDLNVVIEKTERNVITKALEACKGNKTKASKMLNIPRTTLYYKIEQYDIKI